MQARRKVCVCTRSCVRVRVCVPSLLVPLCAALPIGNCIAARLLSTVSTQSTVKCLGSARGHRARKCPAGEATPGADQGVQWQGLRGKWDLVRSEQLAVAVRCSPASCRALLRIAPHCILYSATVCTRMR